MWRLGAHRLICGDATESQTLETLVEGRLADLVFTDPPYGMSYVGGRKPRGTIINDELRGGDLIALVRDSVGCAIAAANETAPVYVCFPWRTHAEFEAAIEGAGLEVTACIVWDKKSIGLGSGHYRPQHEFIFYCARGGAWRGDKGQSDVWSIGRDATGAYVHPTQKPVRLIEKALRNSSRRGDVVLDVFGGSGSTLIACERTRRAARLVELDPRYVDVIVRRWQEFTGEIAILEGSGQAFEEVAQERFAAAA